MVIDTPLDLKFQRPSHLGEGLKGKLVAHFWIEFLRVSTTSPLRDCRKVKIFSGAGSATLSFKDYPGYGWVERCGSVIQGYLL